MEVFKFGGASLATVENIKNVAQIIASLKLTDGVIIVSAMGKTTKAFEKLHHTHSTNGACEPIAAEIKHFHLGIAEELFDSNDEIFEQLSDRFVEIDWILEDDPLPNYDQGYDQLVSMGEILSSIIVHRYLEIQGQVISWLDVRDVIRTDNNYRNAGLDWDLSTTLINAKLKQQKNKVFITQGFIGGSSENFTTTLGLEGSDFTASIFAYCLDAQSMTVWKDVPGLMTADPKKFEDAQFLDKVSYQVVLEMADAGAKVLHPKALRPVKNKNIPLFVRSFNHPTEPGTKISLEGLSEYPPLKMIKEDQVFMILSPKSFNQRVDLGNVFSIFESYKMSINLIQRSAINYSICFTKNQHFETLVKELQSTFEIEYQENLELINVLYPQDELITKLREGRDLILAQRTREIYRMILA